MSPNASWRTFRDCNPSKCYSIVTGTRAVPLKCKWLDLDGHSIEDIVDTGNTYLALHEQVMSRLPASLKIATLLFKPEVYKQTLPIHYTCFEVQNWFYVGYGLDYDELGRNLQHIYKLV